jgi:hypothetical protein
MQDYGTRRRGLDEDSLWESEPEARGGVVGRYCCGGERGEGLGL